MRFVTGATSRAAGKAPDRLSASDEKEMGWEETIRASTEEDGSEVTQRRRGKATYAELPDAKRVASRPVWAFAGMHAALLLCASHNRDD